MGYTRQENISQVMRAMDSKSLVRTCLITYEKAIASEPTSPAINWD